MVVRINGAPRQGVWFSADVRFVSVTVDTTTFITDLTVTSTDPRQADVVNSDLELVIEVLSQRGTVIGLTVVSTTVAQFIVDYGQAIDPLAGSSLGGQVAQNIEAEIEAAVIANTTATTAAVAVFDGFSGTAQSTPL